MDAFVPETVTSSEARPGRLGRLLGRLGGRRRQEREKVGAVDHRPTALGEELELELERAKRGARPVAVLIGELQSLGPAGPPTTGSQALEVIATVVNDKKRRVDTAAAIGDSTFALLLPDTSEQGALVLAERLRAEVTTSFNNTLDLSFGVAAFPRHGRTANALLAAGQRGLQAVRALGGGRALAENIETPSTMVSVSDGNGESDERLEALLALAETVDVRDRGTAQHARTVGRYSELIAREIGFPVRTADRVRLAGLLHDIGKAGVAETLLSKPAPLDLEEWAAVRRHPEIGANLIDDPGLDDVREWVLAHHERPDGRGYPRRLRRDEIPLEARILAVADAYEAMTSHRPYREALTHEAAQLELERCAGTQFEERVVHAFLRVLEREGLRMRPHPVAAR